MFAFPISQAWALCDRGPQRPAVTTGDDRIKLIADALCLRLKYPSNGNAMAVADTILGTIQDAGCGQQISSRAGMSAGTPLDLRVDCYAGHRGEETPLRFSFDGRNIEVIEVLDAWLTPDHRYFKVRGDDGTCYILRNDVPAGRWELTMFDRTGAIG